MSNEYLDYKSVQIYFIFSFLLDALVPYENVRSDLVRFEWKEGDPDERKGLAPTLQIKRRNYYKSIFEDGRDIELIIKNKEGGLRSEICNIKMIGRIFDNLSGTFSFELTKNDCTFEIIHNILRLSEEIQQKEEESVIKINKIKIDKTEKTLCEIFTEKLKENLPSGSLRLVDEDVIEKRSDGAFIQNPYILTIIELPKEDYEKLFFEEKADIDFRKKHYKELGSILYRLIEWEDYYHLSQSFMDRYSAFFDYDKSKFQNMDLDDNLFIHFYRRSCLIAWYKDEETFDKIKPSSFITPSLVNMMEIIRTRWHISIILNVLLDDLIQRIKQFSSRKADISNKSEMEKVLEDVINLRRQLGLFLEDPIPYSFEGGAITEINEIAQNKLWLSDLKNLILEKFNVIDKLFEDVIHLEQLETFKSKF